jgi:hypothetical protein
LTGDQPPKIDRLTVRGLAPPEQAMGHSDPKGSLGKRVGVSELADGIAGRTWGSPQRLDQIAAGSLEVATQAAVVRLVGIAEMQLSPLQRLSPLRRNEQIGKGRTVAPSDEVPGKRTSDMLEAGM